MDIEKLILVVLKLIIETFLNHSLMFFEWQGKSALLGDLERDTEEWSGL